MCHCKRNFNILVEVLDGGTLPSKAHSSDAGFDLYASSDFSINPGEVVKHPLNIRMQLPVGSYGQVESRSGLGLKGFLPLSKIIDRNYRGIPHVIATNVSQTPIEFKKGDRIAQMIIHSHSEEYIMIQVDKIDLDTDRSSSGFGASGK